MKKPHIFLISVISLFLAACAGAGILENKVNVYYISSIEAADSQKIGCGEYLVPIETEVADFSDTVSGVERAVAALLASDLPRPPGENSEFFTSSAFKDKYFSLESVTLQKTGGTETILVSLFHNKEVGLTGVCDTPRIQAQLTETIRTAADNMPFEIYLDGEAKGWKCFDSQSPECEEYFRNLRSKMK